MVDITPYLTQSIHVFDSFCRKSACHFSQSFRNFRKHTLCSRLGFKKNKLTAGIENMSRLAFRKFYNCPTNGAACNIEHKRNFITTMIELRKKRHVKIISHDLLGSVYTTRNEKCNHSNIALMRRTPADTASSLLILNTPNSLVLVTCGPPQNSFE